MIIQLFFNDLRIPYRSASKIQLKKEEYSQIIQDVIRTFIFLMIPQKAQCYYFDIFCDYFVKQNHRHSLRLQTDQCLLWTRDFILTVPLYLPSDGECNKGLLHLYRGRCPINNTLLNKISNHLRPIMQIPDIGEGKACFKNKWKKNNTVKSADFDFFAFKTFLSLFFNLNFKQLNNKKSIDMIGNSLKEKNPHNL